ncbi:hypothetical protein C3L23_07035 [Nautilia sp. PV-1]|uniref:hypothetical protein n=1 Tax=Nautilia sp. PV-1 TaxID=2579250 RepID=UPI000FDCDAB7|nr:hypothetical protein [Nautilia sp. PV-1]AZV47034.1 hypothetical protein C3L23_07035 [Nautilia sp. PV-1]
MRRFAKIFVAGLLLASVSVTAAFADYNKGFKYYQKYVKRMSHIKGTQFLKIIGVQTPDQMKALLKDDAKPLIAKLEKLGKKKAAKAIEKIAKKHKLKDLQDFLVGMLNGKIPAG